MFGGPLLRTRVSAGDSMAYSLPASDPKQNQSGQHVSVPYDNHRRALQAPQNVQGSRLVVIESE